MKNIEMGINITLLCLFLGIQAFGYSAPTKNAHFFGDANGDLGITPADIDQHNNYVTMKVYSYDTLQPNTPVDRWNTCDVDHDRGCTPADILQMQNYVAIKVVSLGADDPWGIVSTLTSPQQPLQVINFQAGLYATPSSGQSGVPGISIEVTIDNLNSTVTGYLVGRDCAGGTGDVPAPPGAQCAIGVAITQWNIDPAYGWTELSPLPLGVYADGNGVIELDFEMAAKASLDLPQVLFSQDITFSGVVPDQIAINCPTNVDETDVISCPVTLASGPSSCAIGANDTCGGSIDAGCVGSYTAPAQGEGAGPGSCVAEVVKGSASDQHNITIDEVNQAPYFTSTAPTSATEGVAFSYNPTYADNDLPNSNPGDPGYVTCAVSGNTCGWLSFTGCDASGTPGEADAPGSCGYTLTVTDGYSATAQQVVSLTVNEVNVTPTWTTAPQNITVNVNETYNQINGVAGDTDLPNDAPTTPGYLTCSKVTQTCSFNITVSGSGAGSASCNVSFTAGNSAESCSFNLRATDGYGASVTGTINVSVISPTSVSINCSNPGPNPVDELSSMSCTVTATGGTPTVNTATDTCGGTITGSGPWFYNFTPTESQGPQICVAGVKNGSAIASDTVTINEVNESPYWTTEPIDLTMGVNSTYNKINGEGADVDIPNSSTGDPGYLTCTAMNNTCSFLVNVSGSGVGNVGCNMSFTTGSTTETCTVDVVVSDDYSASINKTITINVKQICWVNGGSIQSALNNSACQEVWVVQGIYYQTVTLVGGKGLYGGFSGSETSREERDWINNPTILDGNNTAIHVVTGVNNSLIDGFTIRNGNANNNGDNGRGGGMFNKNRSNVIVRNCVFENNRSKDKGGAISNINTSITIESCTFIGNSSREGGAIHNDNSSVAYVKDSVFYGNSAATKGGAEYNKNNRTDIPDIRLNSLYINNTAGENGGAIYNENSTPSYLNCTIADNQATNTGGGIYNRASSPTITNCIVWNNTATTSSQMYNDGNSYPTVTYTDFQGGYSGTGNINANPLFVIGPGTYGGYYLSQTSAGQPYDSPCVNAGDSPASNNAMNTRTTRTDLVTDSDTVDMGFHYLP